MVIPIKRRTKVIKESQKLLEWQKARQGRCRFQNIEAPLILAFADGMLYGQKKGDAYNFDPAVFTMKQAKRKFRNICVKMKKLTN